MALNYTRAQVEIEAIRTLSNDMVEMLARVNRLLEHNSDLAIDWGAGATPAYLTESQDGNLSGFSFTRQNVANGIGSLDQFRRLLTNLSVNQGDHLGNLNILSEPIK